MWATLALLCLASRLQPLCLALVPIGPIHDSHRGAGNVSAVEQISVLRAAVAAVPPERHAFIEPALHVQLSQAKTNASSSIEALSGATDARFSVGARLAVRQKKASTAQPLQASSPQLYLPQPPPFLSCLEYLLVGLLVATLCVWQAIRRYRSERERDDSAKGLTRALPAWVTKADAIFSACDRDRDNFLTLGDLQWLEDVTAGTQTAGLERKLTDQWFCDVVCRPLGADPQRGLSREDFRQFCALQGKDVEYDHAVVSRVVRQGGNLRFIPGGSQTSPSGPAAIPLSAWSPSYADEATKTTQGGPVGRLAAGWCWWLGVAW